MKSIGIDIGTSSIKLVEVNSTSKGVQVLSFTEHLLGQNPAHDPELEVLEFLQAAALRFDAGQTKVVMGMRQEQVSVRLKNFPFTDRLKILKSLPFELEEDLPFSTETAIYEERSVRFMGNTAEVLACATPKHRIAELIEKYGKAGLTIDLLTAEGLAFSTTYERWWEPIPQGPSLPMALEGAPTDIRQLRLVIQMGHTHCLVTAFEDNHVVAVRSILWGGKSIADALSRKYEIPYVEALREMRTKAFILPNKDGASYDQIVFSDTISSQVREFSKELKLSILELETELNGKIMGAEVTGGLAGILHLGPFMTQLIEVPVNVSSPLVAYATHFEKTQAIENSIGTALGLALEGLRKPRNPALQFLRGEFAPQNENWQVFWETWGQTLKVASALVLVFFAYTFIRDSLAGSLVESTQEAIKEDAKVIAHLPAKQANEAGVKKYIREKRLRAQELKALEGLSHMNSALEILRKISDAAPARSGINLNIKFLKIEDQSVTLEGTVGNAQDRSQLQKGLGLISKNGKVMTRDSGPAPGVLGIPFAFSFPVDRGIEK